MTTLLTQFTQKSTGGHVFHMAIEIAHAHKQNQRTKGVDLQRGQSS